ncbi:acyl-CoA dehydratase activase [Candidatus Riflebacteria bacterium]
MTKKYALGIDLGSVSLKVVVFRLTGEILENYYVRTYGQPLEKLYTILEEVFQTYSLDEISTFACTGAGGRLLSEITGFYFVNEVIAQTRGLLHFQPEVKSIIEIGGQDSKLILIGDGNGSGGKIITDFSMNSLCAAGTGSFLDQQASRIGVSIEDEFSQLALQSDNPPRIAGRCSVFAKSDMIHLQQEATPVHDILAGLCYALVRNFKSTIAKGKFLGKPVSFQGGVAANQGIVQALFDLFQFQPDELIIPPYFTGLGAFGSILQAIENKKEETFLGLDKLRDFLHRLIKKQTTIPPLKNENYSLDISCKPLSATRKIESYLGVDVGSISTNVVLIDRDRNVLARRYLMTAGNPLKAVTQGLFEIGEEVAGQVEVKGVCTTGSGRYLTADFIGGDTSRNEITAHARAAIAVCPDVDTVFEIGGQDSKYISMENGMVVDFTMNRVCAAGTGSFLEEQSERLGLCIKKEFACSASSSDSPCSLGERCTVFMESDIIQHMQTGAEKRDLAAGLSYSIVHNYLNRVVENRKIGDRILFQGGVAYNRGVKAAFEQVTGKKVMVPPHHDCMGAIGSALIALEEGTWEQTKFKSFDLRDKHCSVGSITCADCSNNCNVKKLDIQGEKSFFYGDRCGKYENRGKVSLGRGIPRLFREREKLLLSPIAKTKKLKKRSKTVGIPRGCTFHELFPLWATFFSELGYNLKISKPTCSELIKTGVEKSLSETCFPIKVAHGHVDELLNSDIDVLFLPSVIQFPRNNEKMQHSFLCPYIQSLPYIIAPALNLEKNDRNIKILKPAFDFAWGRAEVVESFMEIAAVLSESGKRVTAAIKKAFCAQENFYKNLRKRGQEILDMLSEDQFAVVIIGRPYNSCDTSLNLDIPEKLREMGILAIPMDFLPLHEEDISNKYGHMYWSSGSKIIAAARFLAREPRLFPLYISNFGCGPDAFIQKYFDRELKDKPKLYIELDEHSADAGVITRCQAFIDSLQNYRKNNSRPVQKTVTSIEETGPSNGKDRKQRKLFIPYMDDHMYLITAAMRACGQDAEVLPKPDSVSTDLGRKLTSGKECFPAILTTGDLVKWVKSPDFKPDESALFFVSSNGPCRFGQYNHLYRIVLDDMGFKDVPVITLNQDFDYHNTMATLGKNYNLLAWQGVIFVDYLKKMLLESRPYELRKGSCNSVYQKFLKRAVSLTEKGENLEALARKAVRAFQKCVDKNAKRKPIIGILGEIYVRNCTYSNNELVQRIEELGGEALMPPFEEWINYVGYCRKLECVRKKEIKKYTLEAVTEGIQRRKALRISQPFRTHLRNFKVCPHSTEILERGKEYIDPSFQGEAVLSMGIACKYAEAGVSGLINTAPFHCMPGTILNATLEGFQKKYPGLPILKIAFDGQEQGNEETRLEAFMHQAHERIKNSAGSS